MNVNIRTILCVCLIKTTALSLSGCFLTDRFTNDEKIERKASNVNVSEARPLETNIDLFESTRNKREIERLSKEFIELKQSVNKVLELESDLQYLVEVIETNNRPEVAFMPNVSIVEQTNPAQLLQSNNQNTQQNVSSDPEIAKIDGKFSNVVVQPAKSIEHLRTELKPTNTSANQRVNNSAQIQQVDESKFSNSPVNLVGNCATPSTGEGFAIHIASFQKKTSAINIINKMLPKVNAEMPCPLAGLIDTVTVNDKLFYSSRLGSFASKSEATNACLLAKRFNSYCAVTTNTGNPI